MKSSKTTSDNEFETENYSNESLFRTDRSRREVETCGTNATAPAENAVITNAIRSERRRHVSLYCKVSVQSEMK